MKIKYLGHSSFLLTASKGTTVVTDPFPGDIGYCMPPVSADAVTLSHHHYDHDFVQAVSGNPQVIDGAASYLLDGVEITAVSSFHDECGGAKRGKNIIYKYNADGICICHFGDLGERFSIELAKKLIPVNVLLIPVGGNYTIDASTAKQYINEIKPNVIIPMHYRCEGCNLDIDGVDKFLSLFAEEMGVLIERAKGEIQLSQGDMCGATRIILMDRSDK